MHIAFGKVFACGLQNRFKIGALPHQNKKPTSRVGEVQAGDSILAKILLFAEKASQ